MQNSSAQEASLILAVRLLGVAFRTAQALSGGSSAPAFNVLREPRERLAPSHPLPRLPRRCTGRDSTRSWPRSRRGPGRGRTRRTGESALTAPLEPSFRNALSPVTCRPGGTSTKRQVRCQRGLVDVRHPGVQHPCSDGMVDAGRGPGPGVQLEADPGASL